MAINYGFLDQWFLCMYVQKKAICIHEVKKYSHRGSGIAILLFFQSFCDTHRRSALRRQSTLKEGTPFAVHCSSVC